MTTQKRVLRLKVSSLAVLVLAAVANPLRAQQGVTDLAPDVLDVRWSDAFQLGGGINAVTGRSAGMAIKPTTPVLKEAKSSEETVNVVTDEKTLKREIDASISCKYNIFTGVKANGMLRYLNNLDASGTSTTVVDKFISNTGYEEAGPYELTDEAKSTMLRDPEAFRNTYGDYFVAATKRAAQFVAVYHIRTTKKKDLDEVKSKIGVTADVPKTDIKGTADFNAKFKQVTVQKSFEYDIDVYMDGYTGPGYQVKDPKKGYTPEDVINALNWFKRKEQGQPYMAKLVHYSSIAPGYRRTIPYDPEVFAELKRLYGHLWEVRALEKALPPVFWEVQEELDKARRPGFKETLRKTIDNFISEVENNQTALVTERQLRNELRSKGQEFVSILGNAAARKAFFDEVMSCRQSEEATGSRNRCRSALEPWEHGYTPDQPYWAQVVRAANGAVDINSVKRDLDVTYNLGKHGLGNRQEASLAINDPKQLIVGWTVKSNWGDTNGSWWKETGSPILLSTRGAVRAQGEPTRGTNWTVTYYVVNTPDYPFFQAVQKQR